MIHVTRNRLAEIVQFGAGQQFQTPLAINAGNQIMITNSGGDEISVSKFSVADGDQKRMVSKGVDEVIRAIVELGGTYPDVVQALTEAKNTGALTSRLEVDALPEAGRSYDRVAQDEKNEGTEKQAENDGKVLPTSTPTSPSPDLFYKKPENNSNIGGGKAGKAGKESGEDDDSDGKSNTKKGFFAKMLGR
jgi:hypothetical protein